MNKWATPISDECKRGSSHYCQKPPFVSIVRGQVTGDGGRPVCRSIPAAKFHHYAELNGATKAELVDGDKARAAALTKKRLKEIAQAVANARWTPNLPGAD